MTGGLVRRAGVLLMPAGLLWDWADGAASPQTPAQSSSERAAQVLADARQALGGDKLTSVKTLVATGRTKRVRGDNLVPIEFEITIELPDKYVRKDEVPAEESAPTSNGFVGNDLIQIPPPATPAAGRPGGPPAATPAQLDAQRAARLAGAKQDFVRLTLGIFASSFSSYPLTFSHAGRAEAPQGQADIIEARGSANFALRLFLESATHLPLMLSWQAPGAARGQLAPVENRLYYADYRHVVGVQLTFRLRRAVGADTTEETSIDRWRVNPKIDPRKFDVAK